MMDLEDEAAEMMSELSGGLERAAPDIAQSYRTFYEELVEQGFSEEQAMTLLTSLDMGLDGGA